MRQIETLFRYLGPFGSQRCDIDSFSGVLLRNHINQSMFQRRIKLTVAKKPYNFYKDANPTESLRIILVLKEIQNCYSHFTKDPTFDKVKREFQKVNSLSVTTPLIKIIYGLDCAVRVCQEWTSSRDFLSKEEISGRNILTFHLNQIMAHAKDLMSKEIKNLGNIFNIVSYEVSCEAKHWYTLRAFIFTNDNLTQLSQNVKCFMECSSIGEYKSRLEYVLSFHYHLNLESEFEECHSLAMVKRHRALILWNIYCYYSQFMPAIESRLAEVKCSLEKELSNCIVSIDLKTNNNIAIRDQITEKQTDVYILIKKWILALTQVHKYTSEDNITQLLSSAHIVNPSSSVSTVKSKIIPLIPKLTCSTIAVLPYFKENAIIEYLCCEVQRSCKNFTISLQKANLVNDKEKRIQHLKTVRNVRAESVSKILATINFSTQKIIDIPTGTKGRFDSILNNVWLQPRNEMCAYEESNLFEYLEKANKNYNEYNFRNAALLYVLSDAVQNPHSDIENVLKKIKTNAYNAASVVHHLHIKLSKYNTDLSKCFMIVDQLKKAREGILLTAASGYCNWVLVLSSYLSTLKLTISEAMEGVNILQAAEDEPFLKFNEKSLFTIDYVKSVREFLQEIEINVESLINGFNSQFIAKERVIVTRTDMSSLQMVYKLASSVANSLLYHNIIVDTKSKSNLFKQLIKWAHEFMENHHKFERWSSSHHFISCDLNMTKLVSENDEFKNIVQLVETFTKNQWSHQKPDFVSSIDSFVRLLDNINHLDIIRVNNLFERTLEKLQNEATYADYLHIIKCHIPTMESYLLLCDKFLLTFMENMSSLSKLHSVLLELYVQLARTGWGTPSFGDSEDNVNKENENYSENKSGKPNQRDTSRNASKQKTGTDQQEQNSGRELAEQNQKGKSSEDCQGSKSFDDEYSTEDQNEKSSNGNAEDFQGRKSSDDSAEDQKEKSSNCDAEDCQEGKSSEDEYSTKDHKGIYPDVGSHEQKERDTTNDGECTEKNISTEFSEENRGENESSEQDQIEKCTEEEAAGQKEIDNARDDVSTSIDPGEEEQQHPEANQDSENSKSLNGNKKELDEGKFGKEKLNPRKECEEKSELSEKIKRDNLEVLKDDPRVPNENIDDEENTYGDDFQDNYFEKENKVIDNININMEVGFDEVGVEQEEFRFDDEAYLNDKPLFPENPRTEMAPVDSEKIDANKGTDEPPDKNSEEIQNSNKYKEYRKPSDAIKPNDNDESSGNAEPAEDGGMEADRSESKDNINQQHGVEEFEEEKQNEYGAIGEKTDDKTKTGQSDAKAEFDAHEGKSSMLTHTTNKAIDSNKNEDTSGGSNKRNSVDVDLEIVPGTNALKRARIEDRHEEEDTNIKDDRRSEKRHADIVSTDISKKKRMKTGKTDANNVKMEIEGEFVLEATVERPSENKFFTIADEDQVSDISDEEFNEREIATLSMGDMATGVQEWSNADQSISSLALQLCEQLRLVLEPTQASKLKGDFRTGKRLNMRKIIPYIASDFRKDKIWMRRTQPNKRTYQIIIAVDDSESMAEIKANFMALDGVAMVAKALTFLDAGNVGIISFGGETKILHPLDMPFSDEAGETVFSNLKFDQKESNFAQMINDCSKILSQARGGSAPKAHVEQLLLILSDGQTQANTDTVKKAVRSIRDKRVIVIFLVLDAPSEKYTFRDLRIYDPNDQKVKPFIDSFPFPFYLIVRNMSTLPVDLSTAIREWFEFVSNDR